MTMTAKYPITVGDEDHEIVTLNPGDKVPSWAEDYVKPEVVEEDHPMAAGTDLYSDVVYEAVVLAAKNVGLEDSDLEGLSAEQIAALVRAKQHGQEMVERFGDPEDDDTELDGDPRDVDPMVKLFGEHNADGNVNAPDTAEPKKSSRSASKSTGSQGGSSGGSDT